LFDFLTLAILVLGLSIAELIWKLIRGSKRICGARSSGSELKLDYTKADGTVESITIDTSSEQSIYDALSYLTAIARKNDGSEGE
jgi:hypothetical protein